MTAQENIERAITRIMLQYPWWASLLLNLERIQDDTIPTMCTDGMSLHWSSAFVESLSQRELVGVLCHEVGHCALMHCTRRGARDQVRWNVAADQAVNALLGADGITLPMGSLPPAPLDQTTEEIYASIKVGRMSCPMMDIMDGTVGAHREIERKWRQVLAQAKGLMPATLRRSVEHSMHPTKNWQAEMAMFFARRVPDEDHTWSRPSRRVPAMPGRKRVPAATIAIAVDTSGSIDGSVLGKFLAEAEAILALTGIRAWVISSDAAVHEVVEPGERLPRSFSGGGGTDFRPAIECATNKSVDGIVYFTDGAGEYPSQAPTCPILWALTAPASVPWGQTVEIF
jgi:predicted metal-dependent peptidase